jgi:hypothetical protein
MSAEPGDAPTPSEEAVAAPEVSGEKEAAPAEDTSEIQPASEKAQDPKEIAKAKKKAADEAVEAKRRAAEEALEAKKRLFAEEEAKRRAAEEEARRVAEAKRQAELEELKKEACEIYRLDEQAVPQMTAGFVGITQPIIDSCCSKLSELQTAQAELIELLAQEDRKVMTLPHMAEVAQVDLTSLFCLHWPPSNSVCFIFFSDTCARPNVHATITRNAARDGRHHAARQGHAQARCKALHQKTTGGQHRGAAAPSQPGARAPPPRPAASSAEAVMRARRMHPA